MSRFSRWGISAILNFRGLIMGSLKSPCTTSYRSSIDHSSKSLIIEIIAFLCMHFRKHKQTDRQINKQMDRTNA